MKKSSFAAMILGTVSGVLFALGMCMALITEWNTFNQGIVFGTAGIALGIVTIAVWRKMENKEPIHFSAKTILSACLCIAGALTLGVGMCLSMVFGKMVFGIAVGLIGIIILLCLIPIIKGLK